MLSRSETILETLVGSSSTLELVSQKKEKKKKSTFLLELMPNLKINVTAQAQTNPSDPKNLGLISYGPQGGLWAVYT